MILTLNGSGGGGGNHHTNHNDPWQSKYSLSEIIKDEFLYLKYRLEFPLGIRLNCNFGEMDQHSRDK